MKRFLKRLVPFTLALVILASIGWYLLVYDREFTRDTLLSQARFFDERGNANFATMLYDLAYEYTGQDEDVAIELANQYKADGNYTKAEYTLTNAIADGGTADLYIALCKTFVEQDKLLDAVNMLDSIQDPAIKMEMDKLRPQAPSTDYAEGLYNEYIQVAFTAGEGVLYVTTDGDYPTTSAEPCTEAIQLPGGETVLYALRVADNGLVSPLTILSYTVGGVIEEAKFEDPAFEQICRQLLQLEEGDVLMTDRLWEITELTIPADCTSLNDLRLLPYVEKITLSDMRLDSLNCFAGLTYLTELHLSDCRFPADDLKVLAGLPKLEKLTLSGCGLSTIANLSGARSLTYLDLSGNTLRNLEALTPMNTLQELYLQHNAVTALDALSSLSELRKLDISYNSVTMLKPLALCSKLEWLNAGNNLIAALDGLDAFPALIHLDVDHNQLTNVDILAKLTGLQELNISNNDLRSILALDKLTNLLVLNCSHNALEELPAFPRGSSLSLLDASYNSIISLYPLVQLEELTYVYVDYNKISSLDHIADCYRLVMVNAYGNPIKSVSKLTEHNIIVNYDPT